MADTKKRCPGCWNLLEFCICEDELLKEWASGSINELIDQLAVNDSNKYSGLKYWSGRYSRDHQG